MLSVVNEFAPCVGGLRRAEREFHGCGYTTASTSKPILPRLPVFQTDYPASKVELKLLICILGFLLLADAYAEGGAKGSEDVTAPLLSYDQCLAKLDATVALASNEPESPDLVYQQFASLERRCNALPQLAHNQGVLAAQAGRWPEAIAHFERSLKLDSRASMTHRHLQQIYQQRAATAYARALNTPIPKPALELDFQQSTHQNAATSTKQSNRSDLHSISTLEYELYAWWQALHNAIGLKEHYIDGFPAAAIRLSRQKFALQEWQNMQREIAFTTHDAVVVVSDPQQNRTLLLLRLIGNRWKIYQETVL